MTRSLAFAIGHSLLFTSLFLHLLSSSFLANSHSSLTVDALPRPLHTKGSETPVARNPFLNLNVELMGYDGNHHDLVRAIIGLSKPSPPSRRQNIKRQLYASPIADVTPRTDKRRRRKRGGDVEAVILNGNIHMPRLQIDHSLFAGSKELPGNEASSSVSENTKRDVTQPPIGPGSGSSYNTGQPYSRRTSKGKGEKSGKLDKKKQGGHQGKHQGKSGKHDKKGDKGKSA